MNPTRNMILITNLNEPVVSWVEGGVWKIQVVSSQKPSSFWSLGRLMQCLCAGMLILAAFQALPIS